jgi:hypothetical protein
MLEPDPSKHHIFEKFSDAMDFYNTTQRDMSLTDEEKDSIKPPRQAINNFWIIDRID